MRLPEWAWVMIRWGLLFGIVYGLVLLTGPHGRPQTGPEPEKSTTTTEDDDELIELYLLDRELSR